MITHESSLNDYSSQLRYVLEHYENHDISGDTVQNVVLGGLGGSGIGASLAKSYFFDKLKICVETVKDYHLPAYVGKNTVVVLYSYSGETEETLNLYTEAREAGCGLLVLSSGGTITERCKADGVTCYKLPTGYQPRMTIGYGLSYLLLILGELNGDDMREAISEIADELDTKQEHQIRSAETIFTFFEKSIQNKFVILADREMYAIAIRFSQQINENAKLEAFVHAIPESNHNVLESYTDRLTTNFILLYTEQNPRVSARFDFLTGHLEMDNNRVLPLSIPQYDLFTIYDIIYRLDWVSVMMANEIGAPIMEIPIISDLKEFLLNIEEVEATEEENDESTSGANVE